MNSTTIKIVLFGAGSVGKSAVAIRFVQGSFVDRYDPTIEDLYRKIISVDDRNFMLEIMDTAGTESFLAMRDLYIKNAQGFVLMYSIISRSTFTELEQIKNQIINVKEESDAKQVPMILIGNKCDLESMREVSYEQGEELAKAWGDCAFMETSAKSFINIDEAFEEVTRQVLRKIPSMQGDVTEIKKKKKSKCIIL